MYEDVEVNSERWFDLTPLLNEEFRDIVGYEKLYQVSNYGRIKSLEKTDKINSKNQYICFNANRKVKEKILTNNYCKGYCRVTLSKNNIKKIKQVHRLVAETFILNTNSLPEVNHKNSEKKDNNRIDNLEWVTSKENCNYGNRNEKISNKHKKKIIQLDKNFKIIKIWNSIMEASRYYNTSVSNINLCLKKHNKTACGYIWRYFDE